MIININTFGRDDLAHDLTHQTSLKVWGDAKSSFIPVLEQVDDQIKDLLMDQIGSDLWPNIDR